MPSLPASQLADDGEADGTPVPPAVDPSSEESLPYTDGTRNSVGPASIGRLPNYTQTEALARGRTGCELRPTLAVHKLRPWKQTGKVVDSTCTQTEALLRADYRCVKSTTFCAPP